MDYARKDLHDAILEAIPLGLNLKKSDHKVPIQASRYSWTLAVLRMEYCE